MKIWGRKVFKELEWLSWLRLRLRWMGKLRMGKLRCLRQWRHSHKKRLRNFSTAVGIMALKIRTLACLKCRKEDNSCPSPKWVTLPKRSLIRRMRWPISQIIRWGGPTKEHAEPRKVCTHQKQQKPQWQPVAQEIIKIQFSWNQEIRDMKSRNLVKTRWGRIRKHLERKTRRTYI